MDETKACIFTVTQPKVDDDESSARLGRLCVEGRKAVETPNFLAITSRGSVPHITPDVLSEHTSIEGVYLALEDFIEKASTKGNPPVLNSPARKSTPLHTFTALPPWITTMLAPRRSPAVTAPYGNTDHAIQVFTSVGFQSVSESEYIQYVARLRPDIVVGLSDISYGTIPGTKRVEKMGHRTGKWLDSLITELKTEADNSKSLSAIFAPVLPIDFHLQWEYLHHIVDELAESISGLAFYSSSLLPDIPATTRLSSLPRLSLDEPASPHHILRQVSLGMDLFTIPFVDFATDGGLALQFEFPKAALDEESFHAKEENGSSRVKPLAIDLSLPKHAKSVAPLMKNCNCYACTSHHRAYIHHLLSAKEMLGWVLLQIHNHQILSSFFSAIQESIKAGTYEADREIFEREYESELPEGTGQKPRARGYQFKSEGPGEKKKNKPAWGNLGGAEEVNGGGGDTPLVPEEEDATELKEKGFAEIVADGSITESVKPGLTVKHKMSSYVSI